MGIEVASPLVERGPAVTAVVLTVNGKRHEVRLEPRVSLLDGLREHLGLTGSKKGCDQGTCGACTVWVDGRRVLACLTLAVACEGREVTTIEGLSSGGDLHPMQAAFVERDAFQCGYCTPGQIMSAVALLEEGLPLRGVPEHPRRAGAATGRVGAAAEHGLDGRQPVPTRAVQLFP